MRALAIHSTPPGQDKNVMPWRTFLRCCAAAHWDRGIFRSARAVLAQSNPVSGPSCADVAIGGDRLYVTESVTGVVLVADPGELK